MATGNNSPKPPDKPTDVRSLNSEYRYVARQPILDRAERVFAYELLFRSQGNHFYSSVDPDAATRSTIDLSLLIGTQSLTDGKRAFINCTRELLVSEAVRVLPRDLTVLEILENVAPDTEVLDACRHLKGLGYVIALDDLDGRSPYEPFLPLVDILKVDFQRTSREEQLRLAQYSRRGLTLLAEKIETREEFHTAISAGYQYFQGYFFCKPKLISTHDIPALDANSIEILRAIHDTEFNARAIERVIRREPGLCYRLLRYLNSAAFGLFPVRSIERAIVLLGQSELRKWFSIISLISMAGERSSELIVLSLARANFCESIAPAFQCEATEGFLVGMLSLVEAIAEKSLPRALAELPLSSCVLKALLGKGGPLAEILSLAIACERGDWISIKRHSTLETIHEEIALKTYSESLNWARKALVSTVL